MVWWGTSQPQQISLSSTRVASWQAKGTLLTAREAAQVARTHQVWGYETHILPEGVWPSDCGPGVTAADMPTKPGILNRLFAGR